VALVGAPDFYQNRLVLVTGGTGFIGRRLVAALQARGARARVLVRPDRVIPMEWSSLETIVGDLADTASLARACAGIDTVIHAAGFAHADAGDIVDFADRHWAINTHGTFQLLDAAVAAGVRRFGFVSSIKAVGDPGPHCVDESWEAPPATSYGLAKRAAEERVLAVGRESGLHAVNLRPALVYGSGMKGNLARLITAVQRGVFPPLPETGNRRSLVHVDDVAQAVLLVVAHPAAAGQSYFVTDGQPYSGRELYAMTCQALGRSVPRWSAPASLLHAAATLADSGLWLTGRRERRAASALDKLLGWACYDATRIRQELGYCPAWTFQRYCETELQKRRK
jgi:UDP-glucose 4-epimerase